MADETITKPKFTVDSKSIENLESRITSLEVRVAQMEVTVKGVASFSDMIRNTMYGTDKEPGIMERLRNIERYMNDTKKLGWAAVAVLVGLVLTQIYYILSIHPLP